ncbi:MAG TPA: hypothetical protein DD390_00385 [Rhodospirillaceae bacterium]|nr:hypothetical protein [Rhodospirillaceae bacterium]MAX61906.1 hypothetical protein [Rhodospirillaceae bacterium]HBM11130.1 hypothetical protein [Rhodospirillaceae bacterium]|tara:strand:- start:261 stop:1229 length:969 start_codon:yes stop_codon:yes gene_type:complete
MTMFQKRKGNGVQKTLFGAFVAVEEDRVVVQEHGGDTVHRVKITHDKSPNVDNFLGKKIGSTDLTLEEGAIMRFDGVTKLGDDAEASYAKILIKSAGAVLMTGVAASIRERSGSDGTYRFCTIIDRNRSVEVKDDKALKKTVAAIAADDSLVKRPQARSVMVRILNPAPDEKSEPHFTFVEFGYVKGNDTPLADRVIETFMKEGGPDALKAGARVEVTPVLELPIGQFQKGVFADDTLEPALFEMESDRTKKKLGFATVDVLARLFDAGDESKGYSIGYCWPRFNPDNIQGRLKTMTTVWSPLLQAPSDDDEAGDEGTEAAA